MADTQTQPKSDVLDPTIEFRHSECNIRYVMVQEDRNPVTKERIKGKYIEFRDHRFVATKMTQVQFLLGLPDWAEGKPKFVLVNTSDLPPELKSKVEERQDEHEFLVRRKRYQIPIRKGAKIAGQIDTVVTVAGTVQN